MDANDVRRFLAARSPEMETLSFLENTLFPEVVARLNHVGILRRIAIYGGDLIPTNERNLTDVRNRMSLLIEYKLGWIVNEFLREIGIDDVFLANVVSNRFPDLEARDSTGMRGIRIEVKCLEAVAEEKAANFDTLKKDICPSTDFVVVFLWEWVEKQAGMIWDRAPQIISVFVFHAFSLAELRDVKWLGAPRGNLGTGYQGFDLRYAVNCRNDNYNEEEGNYGKLMRIWGGTEQEFPGPSEILRCTIESYRAFVDRVVWSGFEFLARRILGASECVTLEWEGVCVGLANRVRGVLLSRRASKSARQHSIAKARGLSEIVVMTDKYKWSRFAVEASRLRKIDAGSKPKELLNRLVVS